MEYENITIEEYVDGLPEELVVRLARFFISANDGIYGRWREGPHSQYVCYPVPEVDDEVIVFDELTGVSRLYGIVDSDFGPHYAASRSYFLHNPPAPKEWLTANEGEVWALTLSHGKTAAYFLNGGLFQNTATFANIQKDSTAITAGEKLWPRD